MARRDPAYPRQQHAGAEGEGEEPEAVPRSVEEHLPAPVGVARADRHACEPRCGDRERPEDPRHHQPLEALLHHRIDARPRRTAEREGEDQEERDADPEEAPLVEHVEVRDVEDGRDAQPIPVVRSHLVRAYHATLCSPTGSPWSGTITSSPSTAIDFSESRSSRMTFSSHTAFGSTQRIMLLPAR